MRPDRKMLAARFRALRARFARQNLSSFARLLGVSRNTCSRWERAGTTQAAELTGRLLHAGFADPAGLAAFLADPLAPEPAWWPDPAALPPRADGAPWALEPAPASETDPDRPDAPSSRSPVWLRVGTRAELDRWAARAGMRRTDALHYLLEHALGMRAAREG